MKQILKKASSVCTALLCAATLTMAGSVVVMADEIDETLKSQITMTAEGLAETIVPLTDEEIELYMESGDEFTMNAMSSWVSAKEELGELVELGETEVEVANGTYTVNVPAEFELNDATFTFVFDETGVPSSMAVNVDYPLSTLIKQAGLNTVMGIGIVFLMLLFLAFLISLFRFIPKLEELFRGKKNAAATAPEAPAPAPVVAPVVETVADDTELIAVIAAAIAAAEGTSTDGFVVRSIRKVNRKRW